MSRKHNLTQAPVLVYDNTTSTWALPKLLLRDNFYTIMHAQQLCVQAHSIGVRLKLIFIL